MRLRRGRREAADGPGQADRLVEHRLGAVARRPPALERVAARCRGEDADLDLRPEGLLEDERASGARGRRAREQIDRVGRAAPCRRAATRGRPRRCGTTCGPAPSRAPRPRPRRIEVTPVSAAGSRLRHARRMSATIGSRASFRSGLPRRRCARSGRDRSPRSRRRGRLPRASLRRSACSRRAPRERRRGRSSRGSWRDGEARGETPPRRRRRAAARLARSAARPLGGGTRRARAAGTPCDVDRRFERVDFVTTAPEGRGALSFPRIVTVTRRT